MRQIKFRAWDKKSEQMTHFDLRGFVATDIGELKNDLSDYNDLHECIREHEIMQFTGLLDKTGKEIYEGDIVRILYTDWPSKSDSNPRTLQQYLTDIAKVKVVIWSYNGFYVSHALNGYAESMEYGKYGYIEIIGNIYQHPNLLTQ